MIDELASARGSPFMEQRYESNRRHSEFRVCRAPSTGLGHNDDLQRDPEGKENHPTEDPQRLRIARARNYHRKHNNHDGEADQDSSDEANCFTKCVTKSRVLHDSL
jgi:hypothetical protein